MCPLPSRNLYHRGDKRPRDAKATCRPQLRTPKAQLAETADLVPTFFLISNTAGLSIQWQWLMHPSTEQKEEREREREREREKERERD